MEKVLVARRSQECPSHASSLLVLPTASKSLPPSPANASPLSAAHPFPPSARLDTCINVPSWGWADKCFATERSVEKESVTQVTGDRKGRELVREGFWQEVTPEGLSEVSRGTSLAVQRLRR